MGGPPWECPPERLKSGRTIYRCNYGHMHGDPSVAWGCEPSRDRTTTESQTGDDRG